MACQTIASGTGFGNQCLAWVQNQAGLPHVGATACDAWNNYYQGARSGSGAGNLIFFSAAPINGGNCHVGFDNGDGTFTSVLSDGNEYTCDVGTFNQQNGTSTLGYVSVAAIGGKAPNPATSAGNAISSALKTASGGGTDWGRYILLGFAALIGLYAAETGGDALGDLF